MKNKQKENVYYNYIFKCPTKMMDGQIKFFSEPIDVSLCFICKKPKGAGPNQCNYEINC